AASDGASGAVTPPAIRRSAATDKRRKERMAVPDWLSVRTPLYLRLLDAECLQMIAETLGIGRVGLKQQKAPERLHRVVAAADGFQADAVPQLAVGLVRTELHRLLKLGDRRFVIALLMHR